MTPDHLTGAASALLVILLLAATLGTVATVLLWGWLSRYASIRLDKSEDGRVDGAFTIRARPATALFPEPTVEVE